MNELQRLSAEDLRPGSRFRDAEYAPEMVVLPKGKFIMGEGTGDAVEFFGLLGIDQERDLGLDEEPAHLVEINYLFAIGADAVTFAEYDAFAIATASRLPDDEGNGRDTMPVINVSWHDAKAYVQWLSEQTGHSYRLPSESEWEYAARAGTTTNYWWGDSIDIGNANFIETPGSGPFPIGSLGKSPWGLSNMNGNVDEWVEDCYHASYVGAPSDGRAWVTDYTWNDDVDDPVRVSRGGCWRSDADEVRAAYRDRTAADTYWTTTGFRVARDVGSRNA